MANMSKEELFATSLTPYVQKKTNGNVSYYGSNLSLNNGNGYLKCSKCKALLLLPDLSMSDTSISDINGYLELHVHLTEIVYKESVKEVIKEVFIYGPDPSKTPKPLKQSTGRKFR